MTRRRWALDAALERGGSLSIPAIDPPASSEDPPLVAVVIPTIGRPHLVRRAVASALTQTERRIEVIVVLDGPDPATTTSLESLADGRLRIIVLESRQGAPAARNRGIAAARAPWIALLDDDDEWLPRKLELQLRIARGSGFRFPVVSCQVVARTGSGARILPRRGPRPDEPVSEYLAVRHHLFHGEGLLLAATLLAPTDLFRLVPFTPGVRRFQDFDWILHAAQIPGFGLRYCPEPLLIWNEDDDRPRIGLTSGWRPTFDWVRGNRELFTGRAYAAVITGLVSSMARDTHDPRVAMLLLAEAVRRGRPGIVELVTFVQVWLIPRKLRRGIRDLMTPHRRVAARPGMSSAVSPEPSARNPQPPRDRDAGSGPERTARG